MSETKNGTKRSLDTKDEVQKEKVPKKTMKFNMKRQLMSLKKPTSKLPQKQPSKGLCISLKSKKAEDSKPKLPPKASVFNESESEEEEEMPLEARMRMKNVGRDTPTSSGPNSFNKSRLGFSDSYRNWQKKQDEMLEKLRAEKDK